MRLMQILSFRKNPKSFAQTEIFEADTVLMDDAGTELDFALMSFEHQDTVPAPLPLS